MGKMYCFISRTHIMPLFIFNMNLQKNATKFVLLGSSGAGKTSLIMQFVNGIFDGLTKPTIGASFVSKSIEIDNSLLNISVWDTAGQELYRGLTPMYYRNAAVAIVVFDVTNKDSFEQVSGWVSELHENTSNAIVCICGNKIDLENRIISTESAKELANNLNLSYYETSAATGEGVDKMFLELSLQILSNNKELAHPMHEESTVQLSEDTHKSKEGCC